MVRPAVDPELAQPFDEVTRRFPALNDETLALARSFPMPPIDELLEAKGIEHRDVTVPGPRGAPEVTLAVFTRTVETPQGAPCYYWVHGGGMVLGNRAILAQVLDCPMIDHRNTTLSSHQYGGDWGGWNRETNAYGWAAVIGATPADQVSPYVSPALASDLSGLPPAYIAAGSAEVFRDEDVEYASRIWAAGGQAELHIWAGGFHGFDLISPTTAIGAAARAARSDWIGRQLTAAAPRAAA